MKELVTKLEEKEQVCTQMHRNHSVGIAWVQAEYVHGFFVGKSDSFHIVRYSRNGATQEFFLMQDELDDYVDAFMD